MPSASRAFTLSGWSLQRPCAQATSAPLSAACERSSKRSISGWPDYGAIVGVAEQLEPCLVGVHDDAFLHLQDGVVGALQHRLQLPAVVAGRLQRGVQRALQAERAQLARQHGLHAVAGRQRDHVARADAHARGDVVLGDLGPHQQQRHLRSELVAHGRGLLGIGVADIGADQQLGVELFQRFAQVAHRGDPGAMNGFTRLAHQAVDEFGRFSLRREHDERYGWIVRQAIPRGWARHAPLSKQSKHEQAERSLAPGPQAPGRETAHSWAGGCSYGRGGVGWVSCAVFFAGLQKPEILGQTRKTHVQLLNERNPRRHETTDRWRSVCRDRQ